jgi:homoserine kinase
MPVPGLRYRIEGEVPAARGLGSSVTVAAGVLAGLDALHGTALGRQRLVGLVSEIEGHPDNAAAGILGGFCVSRTDPATGAYVDTQRFEVPGEIAFVVVSPPVEFVTKESRGTLPSSLPFFDAVRSINSAAYLVAAFASRDYARLRQVAGDFVHEPYRLPRIPGGTDAIAAGVAAGAWTGWLSGSGSSVLCVCERPAADAVFRSMTAAFARASMPSEGRILAADNDGLRIEA